MKVRYITADGTEQVRHNAKCPTYEQLATFVEGLPKRYSMLVEHSDGKPIPAVK